MVDFKLYDVTGWTKDNTIHMLPIISRIKGNQIMKYGQLIEYNMNNIFFLKNHAQGVVERQVPNPFTKNQN